MRGQRQRYGVGFIALALLATAAGCTPITQQRIAAGLVSAVVQAADGSAFRASATSGAAISATSAAYSVGLILPGGVPAGMHYVMPSTEANLAEIAVVVPEEATATVADVLQADPVETTAVTPGESIELSVVDEQGLAATGAIEADDFQSVAASWPVGQDAPKLQVRFRGADGSWGEWTELVDDGAGPDAGQQDMSQVRAGTDTVFFGNADAVQIATLGEVPDALPNDSVDVALVGSPSPVLVPNTTTDVAVAGADDLSVVDAVYRPGTASVQQVADINSKVITRATWGARPPSVSWPVAPTVRHIVVHHTAGSNAYSTQAQAMQQIRNDQEYHQKTRGWADIGYNFIVDKWGNIYEGAAGSLDGAQVGAHTAGFNTGSAGVSMLGDYMTLTPPDEMLRAVAALAEWRLTSYGVRADGEVTLTANSSNTKGWPVGKQITAKTISAHRDLGSTDCPGDQGYAQMDKIRTYAVEAQKSEIDPGYLLSDEVLYNSKSMTVDQIAEFLVTRGKNCTSKDGATCLKDYRETTTTREATAFCPGVYTGAADETAAQILAKVSTACGINPQVLLVTLQKEQGLLTNARSPETYAKALGFRCPQAGTCEQQYSGFANQVYSAASRFKQYAAEPDKFPMKAGAWNEIPYSDVSSCGKVKIFIRNQATASLYNYTPQVPNPAGSGQCAPNGNLNFWNFFNQWFGNPLTGAKEAAPLLPSVTPTPTATTTPAPAATTSTPAPTPTATTTTAPTPAPSTTSPAPAPSTSAAPTPNTSAAPAPTTASPAPAPTQKFATVGTVSISGTQKVDYVITAQVTGFAPEPTSYTYQWLRGKTKISGATGQSYSITSADRGKTLSVVVTAKLAGYQDAQISAASSAIPSKYFKAGTVTMTGKAKVGETLTAKPSKFSPKPASYTYEWLRNGVVIKDATSSTYQLTDDDLGAAISVRVTAARDGYNNRVRTTNPVTVS